MKKTLFLSAVFGLSCMNTFAASAVDVFVPQSIINVQQGDEVSLATTLVAGSDAYTTCTAEAETETSVREVLEQTQLYNTANTKRSAIVKDGQGTLVVGADVAMSNALLVREGTLKISGATVINAPAGVGASGNNLSVGGMNAHLVLDHATYTTVRADGTDPMSTSSVSIGSVDGDAVVDILNGSTLHTRQTIFLGGNTAWFEPASPSWETRPHKGGSYASVDSDPSDKTAVGEGNSKYNAGYAAFQNPYETALGTRFSTAVVNVEGGSLLESGSGFYIENATLNINASTVNTGKETNADNVFVGGGVGTKAVLNITDGGKMNVLNNQQFNVSSSSSLVGNDSEIHISGQGSQLNLGTYGLFGYFSKDTASTSQMTIADGGELNGTYLYLGSSNKTGSKHTLSLNTGGSVHAKQLYMYSGSSLTVDSSSLVNLTSGVVVFSGATLENHGTLDTLTEVEGVLSGAGVFGQTILYTDGKIVVGHSPGLQRYNGDLTLYSGSTVEFSVDDLLAAQAADADTAGWGTGAYSVINMQDHNLLPGSTWAITLGTTALSQLDDEGVFELELVQNIGNAAGYTDAVLSLLLDRTIFTGVGGEAVSGEENLLRGAHYEMRGNNLVLTNVERVPEPATATLSLLALAGLCARRRRL